MLMISVGSLGAALWLAPSASLEDAIARPTIDRGPPQSVDGAKPTQKTGKNRNLFAKRSYNAPDAAL